MKDVTGRAELLESGLLSSADLQVEIGSVNNVQKVLSIKGALLERLFRDSVILDCR